MNKLEYLQQQVARAERLAKDGLDRLTAERLQSFAAECREQEVRDLILITEDRFQPAVHREHPVLTQYRHVLHDLGIESIEAVDACSIGKVMARDLIQPSASRIVGGRPPVDPGSGHRVHVRGIGADPWSGRGGERAFDRDEITGRVLQREVIV